MSRGLHLAMLAERIRQIELIERRLIDPAVCLPRVIWWAAALTGTGATLYMYLRRRLQLRLARLHRERKTLVELLHHLDLDGQRDGN